MDAKELIRLLDLVSLFRINGNRLMEKLDDPKSAGMFEAYRDAGKQLSDTIHELNH